MIVITNSDEKRKFKPTGEIRVPQQDEYFLHSESSAVVHKQGESPMTIDPVLGRTRVIVKYSGKYILELTREEYKALHESPDAAVRQITRNNSEWFA